MPARHSLTSRVVKGFTSVVICCFMVIFIAVIPLQAQAESNTVQQQKKLDNLRARIYR